MSLRLDHPPEQKKKRRKKNPSSSPWFSLLPDELALNCLARIPRSNYTTLSVVSKSLHTILSSTELYSTRSQLGYTEHCLYVCLSDASYQFPQWFTLWFNPSQKKVGPLLVPLSSFNLISVSNAIVVVVGSDIYVIGGGVDGARWKTVRVLDCRTHTWRYAPSMNVARKNAFSCVYDGKIYVTGGNRGLKKNESWGEVFDTKTQTWERLPDPDLGYAIPNCNVFRIREMEGKIIFGNFFKEYGYDTKQGKWEDYDQRETFVMSGCVIENLSFSCGYDSIDGPIKCWWCDIEDGELKEVKGLESLGEKKNMRNGGSSSCMNKIVSCGGKLLLIWEVYRKRRKNIWCAEIMVEKRDGGEVWGNVEWVDVVRSVPSSCYLLHCLPVCV